jgi:hypothetical protein
MLNPGASMARIATLQNAGRFPLRVLKGAVPDRKAGMA